MTISNKKTYTYTNYDRIIKDNSPLEIQRRQRLLLTGSESGPDQNIDLFAALRFIADASQYKDSIKRNVDAWIFLPFYQASMLQKLNLN